MNETLKRRLVGAAVLVAVGVLIPVALIKWLQPAPPPAGESVRVYEITPSGEARPVPADEQERSAAPSIENGRSADAGPTQSVSDSQSPVETEPAPEQVSEPDAEAQPKPQPVPAPNPERASETERPAEDSQSETDQSQPPGPAAPEPEPGGDAWVVQVGSFTEEGNAMSLMRELSDDYPAFYREGRVDEVVHYRVRVGPYPSEEAADEAASSLRGRGLNTQVQRAD